MIERGQVITGRLTLSNETGISEQSIRTCLKRLESTGEIMQKSTNKFTIITVCNYDNYQQDEPATNQQLTNNQPATNQQLTTNKNIRIKELKKEDSKIAFSEFVRLTQTEYDDFQTKYGKQAIDWMIEKLSAYKESTGKKYKSDAGAIRSWVIDKWVKDGNLSPQPAKQKRLPI